MAFLTPTLELNIVLNVRHICAINWLIQACLLNSKTKQKYSPLKRMNSPRESRAVTNKASRALHPTFAPQLTASMILWSVSLTLCVTTLTVFIFDIFFTVIWNTMVSRVPSNVLPDTFGRMQKPKGINGMSWQLHITRTGMRLFRSVHRSQTTPFRRWNTPGEGGCRCVCLSPKKRCNFLGQDRYWSLQAHAQCYCSIYVPNEVGSVYLWDSQKLGCAMKWAR